MNAETYQKTGEYVTRQFGEEVLTLPVATGIADVESLFVMNEVAARIWALVDDGATPAQIAATLVAEYDVAPAEALADVAQFFADLEASGLVRKVN